MKPVLLLAALVVLSPSLARATAFGDFQNRVTGANLKPFALDVGGILGGAAFHSGRTLGWPHATAGVVGTVQLRPDRDDLVLRDAGVERFGFPLVQVDLGLPRRVDIILHGGSSQGALAYGGGVRWGIHKTGYLSLIPDFSLSAFGDRLNHQFFHATHLSVNAVVSMHLPILRPYAGFGLDHTTVTAGAASTPGLAGTAATAKGTRWTAGVNAVFIPFFHFYAAYNLLHGLPGLDLGAGLRF